MTFENLLVVVVIPRQKMVLSMSDSGNISRARIPTTDRVSLKKTLYRRSAALPIQKAT